MDSIICKNPLIKNLLNKYVLVFVFTISIFNLNAQFSDEQITLLTKMNCAYKGAWVIDGPEVPRPVAGRSNKPKDAKNLEFTIYHYNSWEGNTQGEVSLSIFQNSQEAEIREDIQDTDDQKVVYLNTKSFFVVIQYEKEWNDFYDKEMKQLIPDIKKWFKENSEKL